MMKRNLLALSALVLAAGTAHAGSQFFYQTPAHTNDVSVGLGYENDTMKTQANAPLQNTATGTAMTITGMNPLDVHYEYGINDMLSVGADLGWVAVTADSTGGTAATAAAAGFADPTVFVKGQWGMGSMHLHYGLSIDLGFQNGNKASTLSDVIETPINRRATADGGYSFTPYIGLSTDMGSHTVGAKVAYRIQGDRTFTGNVGGDNDDMKIQGGDSLQLSVFAEHSMGDMTCGWAANWFFTGDVHGNMSGANFDYIAPNAPLGLDFYSRWMMGNMTIMPKLSYFFTATGPEYASYSAINASVTGMWSF